MHHIAPAGFVTFDRVDAMPGRPMDRFAHFNSAIAPVDAMGLAGAEPRSSLQSAAHIIGLTSGPRSNAIHGLGWLAEAYGRPRH